LFTNGTGFEINIYSNSPPSEPDYVFYDNTGHNDLVSFVIPVPEPSTCTLCGFAIVSFAGMAWRKRKAAAV